MPLYRTPTADPTKILTRSELALADLQQRAQRSANARLNLVLFVWPPAAACAPERSPS